jgi:hypothetical protein
MKYIKHLLLVLTLPFISIFTKADEGMWLPLLLEKLNEKQMKSLGMKISASDIYNINKGSLKDAIVSFGGFVPEKLYQIKGWYLPIIIVDLMLYKIILRLKIIIYGMDIGQKIIRKN